LTRRFLGTPPCPLCARRFPARFTSARSAAASHDIFHAIEIAHAIGDDLQFPAVLSSSGPPQLDHVLHRREALLLQHPHHAGRASPGAWPLCHCRHRSHVALPSDEGNRSRTTVHPRQGGAEKGANKESPALFIYGESLTPIGAPHGTWSRVQGVEMAKGRCFTAKWTRHRT
jgi:hypothetical protein